MNALLAVLLLALAAMPSAAHVQPFSIAQTLSIGSYSVFLDASPAPIYAGKGFGWSVYVGTGAAQTPATDVEVAIRVASGPSKVGTTWVLSPQPTPGYHLLAAKVDAEGEYNLTVGIKDAERSATGNATVRAYPDLGSTIAAENPNLDVSSNRSQDIAFVTLDPAGKRVDKWPDLRVRLEQWNDGHTSMRFAVDKTMKPDGVGTFVLSYDFPREGMYHIQFASAAGGFTFDETPVLHVTAVRTVDFSSSNDTPGPTALLVLGLAALAAAVAWRRR